MNVNIIKGTIMILIKNANLFNGTDEKLIQNVNVVIENNIVIKITKDAVDESTIEKVIDANGHTALHSGPNSLGVWTDATGKDVISAGNLLANENVPLAIVDGFLSTSGHIGDRLIAAMRSGLTAGGEAGPIHSAGIQICDKVSWPVADLRCDWTEGCPIEAIATAWDIYKPQLNAYIQRALDPREAPSYGVPGDEDTRK